MSFNLHIPIDDIAEADVEADLRQVAGFGKPGNQPAISAISAGLESRQPQAQPNFDAYPVPVAIGAPALQNYEHWGKEAIYPALGVGRENSPNKGGGTRGSDVRFGVGAGREYSDADLAFARHDIQAGRDRLYEDKMKEELQSASKAHVIMKEKENGDDENEETNPFDSKEESDRKHLGVEASRSDADLAEKSKFVNALKKNKHQKLQEKIPTTPSPNKVLMKLMEDLKSIRDEKKDTTKPKTPTIKGSIPKGHRVKGDEDDSQDEGHPYEGEELEKSKNEHGKGKEGLKASEPNDNENLASTESKTMEGFESTTATSKKHKKKGKHHKKPIFGKETQLDNRAVEMMAAVDRNTNRNQTAQFILVSKGKDRVDLPLTETDKGWTHKVHGQRDIVVAGAIVMCLGLTVILVSLIALVRRRFLKSAKRRRDSNNNRRYRTLGSTSETQMLRKPKKSLFPSAMSDDDDDDDTGEDTSTSGEEIIYHQRKVNAKF